jgi:hypothetical protein
MANRQLAGKKMIKRCEGILKTAVIACFVNGDLPHNVTQAWIAEKDAYLVNMKTKVFVEEIINGEFLLRKPVRIRVRKDDGDTEQIARMEAIFGQQEELPFTNDELEVEFTPKGNGSWIKKACNLIEEMRGTDSIYEDAT